MSLEVKLKNSSGPVMRDLSKGVIMRSAKKSHTHISSPTPKEQQEVDKHLVKVHSNLSPLLRYLQDFNAPADQVQANWMARGLVQGFKVIPPKMVVDIIPSKSIPEGLYQYWTNNPLLQIQLLSAYMCQYMVDIFSVIPKGASNHSSKNGGEILTIHVDQETQDTQ